MSVEILNHIVQYFFKHQLLLKMFHFQTKNYGAHKASDAYLITYTALMDQILEIGQGIYGKLDLTKIEIGMHCLNDDTIIEHLDQFIAMLKSLDAKIKHAAFINIRDDMISDAEQLKYLLTFK
jgi:hypothetical protein